MDILVYLSFFFYLSNGNHLYVRLNPSPLLPVNGYMKHKDAAFVYIAIELHPAKAAR